jgi:hypothetical protein
MITIGAPPGGLQFRAAQYVRTSEGSGWFVSGKNVTCLIQAGKGTVSCDTIASVVDHGLAVVVFRPPRYMGGKLRDFFMLGVAPDWAKTVRVKVGNVTRRVAVHENAYALHAGRPIRLERVER